MRSKKNNKSSKVKSFLIFLLLATLFLGLTKLSKQYTSSIQAAINYSNIPDQMMLEDGNPKNLSFDMTANGFEFLSYKLKVPTINIDVSSFYKSETTSVIISRASVIHLVKSQLEKGVSLKDISVNELQIKLSPMITKKIPVNPQLDISFKQGFNQLDSITVIPDSVMISGPESLITSINMLKTKLVSIKNSEKDIAIEAELVLPENKKISVEPSMVRLNAKVVEFSQKQLAVPLEVSNLPPDITLKLIPQIVQVTFSISINDFKTISATDFKIVCDYETRNSEENYMIPKLIEVPKNVRSVEILDKKIDFLIFR